MLRYFNFNYGLIILVLLSIPHLSIQGQCTFTGKIVDEQNMGIPYVTIRLLDKDSIFISGSVADSTGHFVIQNIDNKNYLLALTSIGYIPQIEIIDAKDKKQVSLSIILKKENILLSEVVVKGQSFIRKKDHVLVIPDKQQVKHASNGYDLLYNLMIPSIDVNRRTGKVSTMGGSVSLYIDGEKADYRDIQSLRPRDIENIEYYDVPTGKYANDAAAINYITKRYKGGGYISLDGKQIIGYLSGDYNVSSKVTHNNTTYMVWGGYNNKKHNGILSQKKEELSFPEYTINRNKQTQYGIFNNNQQYVQLKVNNRTKKYALSAEISVIHDNTPEDSNNNKLDYSGYYTNSINSTEKKAQQNLQPSMKLHGDFKLANNQTFDVDLSGTYSQNKYERYYKEKDNNSFSRVSEDMYVFNFSGNYNIQFKQGNSLGVNAMHTQKITSSSYIGDYNSWQHLWSGESLLCLTYKQNIGKKTSIIIRPGLSFLNYKLHSNSLNQFYSLRFNTLFLHRIDKLKQLIVYINIGNTAPDITYLNNVDQTVDFLQIQRGNPNIGNTKIYNTGVTFNIQIERLNMQANIDYMGFINNVFYEYYIEKNKLVNSFRQGGNAHTLTTRLDASYRFSDNLRAKLSGIYYYNSIFGQFDLHDNSFQSTLDLNYFWKDFALNIYGSASTSQMSVWTLVHKKKPIEYGLSISWNHKAWNIEIGTANPFTKQYYKEYANYHIYKYNETQSSRIYQKTGYAKIAYTFDFGRKTSRDNNNVNRGINSAIMKVN